MSQQPAPRHSGSRPQSHPLIATAAAIRAGIPLGARSYDPTPWEPPNLPQAPLVGPHPARLYLLTDLLDHGHAPVVRGGRWYDEALWAYRHQDSWSIETHWEYWSAHLRHWPRKAGRDRKQDADGFAFALAARECALARQSTDTERSVPLRRAIEMWRDEIEADLDDFCTLLTAAVTAEADVAVRRGSPIRGLGRTVYTLREARRRGTLARAAAILAETPRHLRRDTRLPCVAANPAQVIPSLEQLASFDDGEGAGEASYVIRRAAVRSAAGLAAALRG